MASTRSGQRGTSFDSPIITVLAGAAAVLTIAMLVLGHAAFAIPIAILFFVLAGFGAFNWMAARRQVARHGGDVSAAAGDESETFPALGMEDMSRVGVTEEAHRDITPHDLPTDHPARTAVEERDAAGAERQVRRG
jgi:hypothetical protein